jgi:hypothetical protein
MKLSPEETDALDKLVRVLEAVLPEIDCFQAETDEKKPYILISQPPEALNGQAAFFVQPHDMAGGWEVRCTIPEGVRNDGLIAFHPSLQPCLEKATTRIATYLNHVMRRAHGLPFDEHVVAVFPPPPKVHPITPTGLALATVAGMA